MKKKYASNLSFTTLRFAILAIFVFNSAISWGQKTETIPSGVKAAISTAISPKATQKFTYKHSIFAATYFKGNAYSLYSLGTDVCDNINLDDFTLQNSTSGIQLSQSLYKDITDGGTYTSGALAAMGDTLYAFWRNNETNYVWYKPVSYVNGVITVGDPKQVTVTLPTYGSTSEFYTYIAATVCNRSIYLLVERNDAGDRKLNLIKGALNSAGTALSWTYVDAVRDDAGTPITITTGAVNDSYDIIAMHSSNGSDSLMVGRSNNSKFTLHLFRGANKWKTYQKTTPANLSKCFKMVQGAIDGLNVDNVNTLQCIGKNADQTYTEAFDIDNRTFVKEAELPNHVGSFAPFIGMLRNNDYLYDQYISLIHGDLSTYVDIDTYASNKIYRETVTMSDPDKFLKNPELRKLATLVGIVEGPPPSILETEADYAASNAKYGNVSPATLSKSKISTKESESTTTITGGVELGVEAGPVSATMTYTREHEESKKTSFATKQSIFMHSQEIAHRDSATLFYNIPNLAFNSYYLCSPNSTYPNYVKVVDKPIITDLTVGNMSTVTKCISLKEAPFNIANPRLLTSWYQRDIFKNKVFNTTYYQGASAPFSFNASTIENSFTNTTVSTTNNSNEIGLEVEVKFGDIFGIASVSTKASAKFKMSKSNSTTVEDGLSLAYQTYLQSDIPGNTYKAFNTEFALLTDDASNIIADYYYSELKNAGLRRDKEKPWIITYNVTSYTRYPTTEIAQTADEHKLLDIKLYKQSESSISINVASPANDLLTLELYDLKGQKLKTLLNNQSILSGDNSFTSDCPVEKGVYIVKSYTSIQTKNYLIRL